MGKVKKVFGGGGSKTQSQSSTQKLPAWAQKHFEKFGGDVAAAAQRGDLSRVAGFTADQTAAQQLGRQAAQQQAGLAGQGQQAWQDQLRGEGLFAAQDYGGARDAFLEQARRQGGEAASQLGAGQAARGTLGSARGQRAQEAAREQARSQAADKYIGLQQSEQQARRQAAQSAAGQTGAQQQAAGAAARTLGEVGSGIQAQRQKEADKAFTNLQRQGQLLSTAVHGQGTTVQTGPKPSSK